MSIENVIEAMKAYLPNVLTLAAALDPKDAKTIAVAQELSAIALTLFETERQIRAGLDADLMEKIAQANRDADAKLIGN